MPAEHDVAAQAGCLPDDGVEILDGHGHAPVTGKPDGVAVARRPALWLEVLGDRIVAQPADVVVEGLLRGRLAGDEALVHRVVLEQVLAAFNRPHLPVGEGGDDIKRNR